MLSDYVLSAVCMYHRMRGYTIDVGNRISWLPISQVFQIFGCICFEERTDKTTRLILGNEKGNNIMVRDFMAIPSSAAMLQRMLRVMKSSRIYVYGSHAVPFAGSFSYFGLIFFV